MQSPEWEKLQNSVGRKTWRINDILLIQHRLPLGFNYLYCPRPQTAEEVFFAQVREVARLENSVFLKTDPAHELAILTGYKYKNSSSLQPQKTTVLELQKTKEELLGRMHEKTRYNIRLAEKHGVEVKIFQHPSSSAKSNLFWNFILKTAKRAGFSPHVRSYYDKLFALNSESFSNELFLAEFRGEVLAMALINFYRPVLVATYLHGASVREHKEVMASYLLHWRVIEETKKRGFSFYDFWGMDEKKWPGVTRFKSGFGGEAVVYPPTLDVIYRPWWYKVYSLVKKLKKLK